MKNNTSSVVYVFKDSTERQITANSIEQRNGWVFARWYNIIVAGVKEEYLKAFYLKAN